MGMAFPLAFLLIAVAALALVFAYLVSWGMGSRPDTRRRLWLVVMLVVLALSLGPLLFFGIGAVEEMSRGESPAKPLGLFALVVGLLAVTYVRFRRERASVAR